jgi:signal transduction histidine kinase
MKLLQKIRHSLSLRLLLLFLAAGILISLLFQGMLGAAIGYHVKMQVVPHLQQYAEYLLQDVGTPSDPERARLLAERLPVEIVIDTAQGRWQSNPLPAWITSADLPNHFTTRQGRDIAYNFEREGVVLRYQTGDNANSTVFIWGKGWQRPNHRKGGFLLGVAVLLLILATLYYLIRRLFKPIQTIQHGVKQIGSGHLSHRIQAARKDELGELAISINHMADDIEQMLESKRELLLAISHELRSPLTRAKVSLALLDESSARNNIHRDLNEMESMISELLEAERLKGRHTALNKTATRLNDVVSGVVGEHFPAANLVLALDNTLPEQQLDGVRMKLVVRNLLENALKYQDQATTTEAVAVSTAISGDNIRLTIQDHGPGIPAEHLAHLTEPFYRTDASRTRKTGGFGLGLYLVKLIIEAHGGELVIHSEVGTGTTVEVILPLSD